MPVHRGYDAVGYYYQWGKSGKKYYYTPGNTRSENIARNKSYEQAKAIYANGYLVGPSK
jgi:hypothetical protein